MSILENNNSVEQIDDDLDSFSDDFFGRKSEAVEEPASSEEEVEEDIPDSDAPTEDSQETDDSNDEDDSDSDTTEDKDDNPAAKPKKNRFQERIDELTGGKRQAERERDELAARIRELENKTEAPKPTAQPQPKTENLQEPTPTDQNEDGSDKYPLGEFDPAYIRDVARHEFKILQANQAKEEEQRTLEQQQQAMTQEWQNKLNTAQERYPDLDEKTASLAPAFEGVDPAYGEYLAATFMAMDHGPDVLYYLANNHDEARRIIAMGPTKATIALGRIEARFDEVKTETEEPVTTTPRPKVSQAPTPPPVNKGSAAAKLDIPDDTDDLDAFAKKFFKKRR